MHQSERVGDDVSHAGLMAVLRAWQSKDRYAAVWEHLHDAGLVAASPEERRAAMRDGCTAPAASRPLAVRNRRRSP